jgi:FkbM family methyltransferase
MALTLFLVWLVADGCLFGLLYMRRPHCFRRWRCRYSIVLDAEPTGPWLAKTGFGNLILTADPRLDSFIARDLHYRGYWEPEIERVFREVVKEPDGVVIDVGANVGYFSLLALHLKQSVVLVEMQSELVALLTATMTLNGFHLQPNRVKIVHAVLSDQAGTGFRYESKASNPGGVGALETAGGPLKSRTLDSVLAENVPADKSIALMKIDVEGHEERVLAGGKDTIGRCENIIVESTIGFIKKLAQSFSVREINEDQTLGESWDMDTVNPVLSDNARSGHRSNFWLKRKT